MSGRKFVSRFTPSNTEPAVLETIFVQSHDLANDTVMRIRDSALTDGKHHLLLVGPRGNGKTHFVSLIFHRIDAQDDLRDRLRIAWLNEDESSTSFLRLLIRIHSALATKYPDEFTSADLDPAYASAADPETSVSLVGRMLLEKLDGYTLLLIVENLDELLASLGEAGQKSWRAFMQENPIFALLATSQQLTDDMAKRTWPFFGYFRTEYLKPLSLVEAVELLKKIAVLNEDTALQSFLTGPIGRARVRALHHLSGGNHRIYIVLSDFITRDSLDQLVGPFQRMLDELTPYYQERIRSLPPQQREIVEYLCGCVTPVPVKTIQTHLFITHQTATSELKKLRGKRYVTSNRRGRESLYELSEPLMRLCVEVKETQRETVRLIVDFLRIWYSRDELQSRLTALRSHATLERAHVKAAVDSLENGDGSPVVEALLDDFNAAKAASNVTNLIAICEELAEVRGTGSDWLELGYWLHEGEHYDKAGVANDRAIEIDPNFSPAWNNRGALFGQLRRYEEALAAYDRAIEIDPNFALAWNNRGKALSNLSRSAEALAAYDRAIEIDPDFTPAWDNRWMELLSLGRFEDALAGIDRAIEFTPDSTSLWYDRSFIQYRLNRFEDGLVSCERSIECDPDTALAWNGRGFLLCRLGRYEDALSALDKAIELNPEDEYSAHNRVEALFGLNRWDDGFVQLALALDRFPKSKYHGEMPAIIGGILKSLSDRVAVRDRVKRLVGAYAEAGSLSYLGTQLVESVSSLSDHQLSDDGLQAWLDVWQRVGVEYRDLAVSLRIFAAGIRYLKSNDERVLLDLVIEEREILRQSLGLAEPDESSV
jgi:tetratricopeptide (TPR) repeat protein